MRLKQGEQYTFRLADHKIPFPKGVTKCDLQFKVKGIDYISKTIEDVKEHRDKLYCTFTNEDTANMPEGLISYTMTFAGEFIDETEFSGETYVETTMYMTTTEHCGGDCPELEREVELLTDKVAELNSQIDEKDIEIIQLKEDVRTAFDDGVADQKAKLESVTFTENGVFIREDGYDMVTVDVPSSDCPELEEKVAELTTAVNVLNETINEKDAFITILNNTIEERDETITELNGTIAIRDNEIEVLTQEVNDAFDEGVRNQKSKLTSTTIKTNGTYTREDGWNEVHIQIPTEDARILDLTVNLQQMMVNNSNYKYSSFFLFGRNAELNISSSQDVVIIDYEGNCTRYIGQSVTHRCTSYYNMVYVFSNSTAGLGTTYVAKYGCVYSDNITRYDRLPRADKLDMYFTPECEIVGAVAGLKTEIKFHTKDKPNINTIVYPNNLFLYFPSGTDLEDLRAQYPNVTIIEY